MQKPTTVLELGFPGRMEQMEVCFLVYLPFMKDGGEACAKAEPPSFYDYYTNPFFLNEYGIGG